MSVDKIITNKLTVFATEIDILTQIVQVYWIKGEGPAA